MKISNSIVEKKIKFERKEAHIGVNRYLTRLKGGVSVSANFARCCINVHNVVEVWLQCIIFEREREMQHTAGENSRSRKCLNAVCSCD